VIFRVECHLENGYNEASEVHPKMNTSHIFGSYQPPVVDHNTVLNIASIECDEDVCQHYRYHHVVESIIKN